jgi:hypothetical protein
VDEAQRASVLKHRGMHQLLSGSVGSTLLNAGKLRSDRKLNIVTKHGNGLGQRDRAGSKLAQRGPDRQAHRFGTDASHLTGVLGGTRDPPLAQALGKAAQQKRVAACRRLTRGRKLRIHAVGRPLRQQRESRRS